MMALSRTAKSWKWARHPVPGCEPRAHRVQYSVISGSSMIRVLIAELVIHHRTELILVRTVHHCCAGLPISGRSGGLGWGWALPRRHV